MAPNDANTALGASWPSTRNLPAFVAVKRAELVHHIMKQEHAGTIDAYSFLKSMVGLLVACMLPTIGVTSAHLLHTRVAECRRMLRKMPWCQIPHPRQLWPVQLEDAHPGPMRSFWRPGSLSSHRDQPFVCATRFRSDLAVTMLP